MHITDNHATSRSPILVFSVALFISSSAIRAILGNYFEHAALLTTVAVYGVFIFALIIDGIKGINILKSFLPISIVWLLVAWTWIMYPERHLFYQSSLYNLADVAFPIYGAYITAVCLLEESSHDLLMSIKIAAYIMMICYAFQALDVIQNGVWTRESIYNGKIVTIQSNYHLPWGYNVYTVCVIFFSFFLLEHKWKYLVLSSIGLIGILLYGSRGSLVVFAAFTVLSVMLCSNKKMGKRLIALMVISLMIIVLYATGILQNAILSFARKFGGNSRTLGKLLNGTIADMSGREKVYEIILGKIIESPIIGWGIYGDRYFLNLIVQGGSAYSHNVLLELCVSFGMFGLSFFSWIVYRSVRIFRENSHLSNRILVMIGIGGSMSLLFSLSFWNQPMFWVLLAILINGKIEMKAERKNE